MKILKKPLSFFTLVAFTFIFTFSFVAQAQWNLSPNYRDVQSFMTRIAADPANHAQVFDLGLSDSGQMIQGLKIGDGPMNTLVVATHHGNEYGSTEVAKGLAQSLAQAPISGQTTWVIPVLNTSGFDRHQRWENGQDPNRDYPGPCGTDGPFHLKSTKLLADFIAQKNIVASATLHTYASVVVYPWGISTQDLSTPYDQKFSELTEAAARESHYQTGNNTTLLYAADGTFEDYAFWKHGVWSLLFELGDSHNPSLTEVEQMIQVNVPGLRRFLEISPSMKADQHDFTGKCDPTRRRRTRGE